MAFTYLRPSFLITITIYTSFHIYLLLPLLFLTSQQGIFLLFFTILFFSFLYIFLLSLSQITKHQLLLLTTFFIILVHFLFFIELFCNCWPLKKRTLDLKIVVIFLTVELVRNPLRTLPFPVLLPVKSLSRLQKSWLVRKCEVIF